MSLGAQHRYSLVALSPCAASRPHVLLESGVLRQNPFACSDPCTVRFSATAHRVVASISDHNTRQLRLHRCRQPLLLLAGGDNRCCQEALPQPVLADRCWRRGGELLMRGRCGKARRMQRRSIRRAARHCRRRLLQCNFAGAGRPATSAMQLRRPLQRNFAAG